tara:strand:+ start:11725 stop:12366 length:642 start_codon:yes stop_codon:yes gene_type:complete
MEFLPQKIEKYSLENTSKESDLLSELNRETWAKVMTPRMLSGHLQGRLLSMISNMLKPKTIIEIGTYTGYSALCLAEGLSENGTLHTIDINEEYTSYAHKYFQKSDYTDKITQHIGYAVDIIPSISENVQLVFIDADKENYSNYYNLIFDKLEIGGYIIADNVLWSGKVVGDKMDEETKAIDKYNKMIQNDQRVENVLLPVRDGLMICKKISG